MFLPVRPLQGAQPLAPAPRPGVISATLHSRDPRPAPDGPPPRRRSPRRGASGRGGRARATLPRAGRPRPPTSAGVPRAPASGACRAHASSRAARKACTRSPGTLRWMRAFGRRSATSDGRSRPARRSETVSDTGPPASSATQVARRPTSSQVPSTTRPPGASLEAITAHASATSSSPYCRSTLKARTSTGRRPAGTGSSKPRARRTGPAPPAAAPRPPAAGRSRCPPRRRRGARRRRARSSARGDAARAVAEVDDERVGRATQPVRLRAGQPAVDPPQPVRVRRPPGEGAHRAGARTHRDAGGPAGHLVSLGLEWRAAEGPG